MTARSTNIGPERTTFVGRTDELDELDRRLGEHPLVTLLGSGGIGKTRLSRSYGASAERYDEVWFCDLTSAQSEEDFVASVAAAIGLDMGNCASARQLGHTLASRNEMLIILDNLEQSVAMAAQVVGIWLDEVPNATFLATSREPLQIRGECRFELAPLAADTGVELFEQRARLVRDDFSLDETTRPVVEKVVERLDALPLAIELAASRVSILSPSQLLERVEASIDLLERPTRDVSERHQTMRAAIEWSWKLLEADEQQALCEAALFVGGFTLEAAEAVLLVSGEPAASDPAANDSATSGSRGPKRWAGDVVEALVDKSLMRRVSRPDEPFRFDLYSTIREFALDQMDDRIRHTAERAHARYYSALLSEVRSADFSREADNITAAFHRMDGHDADLAAQAALGAYRVLRSRRVYRKIFAIVDRALVHEITDPHLESKLFGARAVSHEKLGRYRAALEDVRAGLAVIEGVDAPKSAVFLQVTESTILRATGSAEHARRPLEDALATVGTLQDPWLEAIVRGNLAVVAFECGEFEASLRQMYEIIDFARRHDAADVEAYACCNAAHYEREMGQLSRAGELLAHAHEVHPGGDRKFELSYLNGLGHLSLSRGEPDEARTYFRRALDRDQSIGDRHSRIPSLLGLSHLCAPQPSRPRDSYLREVLDIVAPSDDSLTKVHALVQLGAIDLERHDFHQAKRRLEIAVSEAEKLEHRRISAIAHAWLSAAQAGLGQADLAHETLDHAADTLTGPTQQGPADEPLLDDLEYFRRAVDLFTAADPPGSAEMRRLVEELQERVEAHRFEPAARIWLWRNYQHLDDLARVVEAHDEYLQTTIPARNLRVSSDGSQFAPPGVDTPVDLSSRAALKRIVAKLAHMRVDSPGDGLSVSQVVEVGWPDDVVTEDAGRSRVYTAIRTLRDQGLSDILITGSNGYMLDPDVPIQWL